MRKTKIVALQLAVLTIICCFESPIFAQAQNPVQPREPWWGWLGLCAFILILMPFGLFALDAWLAYSSAQKARTQLSNIAGTLDIDKFKILAADINTPPPGIPGLSRTLIAFVLLVIIGVSLLYIAITGRPDTPKIVEQILTLLAGALTSITGFYFGTRAAEGAQSDSSTPSPTGSPSETPVAGELTIQPDKAAPGASVTITGAGFGADRGKITFGSSQAADSDITSWNDTAIKVNVPTGARTGAMPIIVTKPDGHQIASPPTAFTVAQSASQ